jgi:hypothetical protein
MVEVPREGQGWFERNTAQGAKLELEAGAILAAVGGTITGFSSSRAYADSVYGRVAFGNGDQLVAMGQPDGVTRADTKQTGGADDKQKAPDIARRKDESLSSYLDRVYGAQVIEIRNGTRPAEYVVFQGNQKQFTTQNPDLVAEMQKRGFQPKDSILPGEKTQAGNYLDYLQRNFGVHVLHMLSGTQESYAAFAGNKTIKAQSLEDLQSQLDKAGLKRIEGKPPETTTVTRLPDGKIAVEVAGGGSLTLSRDKKVLEYQSAAGNTFKPDENKPDVWHSDRGETWNGRFNLSDKGVLSFAFTNDESGRVSRTFRGKNAHEDTYKDNSTIGYTDGRVTKITNADGTIEFGTDGKHKTVTVGDSGGQNRTTYLIDGSARLRTQDDQPLPADKQFELQDRLRATFEKLGMNAEAIRHGEQAVTALEQGYRPGDTSTADYHKHLADLQKRFGTAAAAKHHLLEATEINRVADYLKSINGAGGPLEQTTAVIGKLPTDMKIDAKGPSMQLSVNDFGKLLEAIPGLRLPAERNLAGIKSIGIQDGKLKLEGTASLELRLPNAPLPVQLTLKDTTADVVVDPKDPNKLHLSNIKGLTVAGAKAEFSIPNIDLTLQQQGDGNSLSIAVGKPVPVKDPKHPFASFYNNVASFAVPELPNTTVPIPKEARVDKIFSELRAWASKDEKSRDTAKLAEAITSVYADPSIVSKFGGIKSVEKNGNRIEIASNGGDLHNLGGLPLKWEAKVSAELETNGKNLKLKDIKGVKSDVTLPGDVAQALGMKNPMDVTIKELSLSEPDKDGNRIASLKTDSAVETLSIKVGPNFEPVCDKEGNIKLSIGLQKDGAKVPIEVTFNPQQLAAGDPKKIDFKLSVLENSDQVPNMAEAFIGHQLDDTARGLLKGVTSISKKGDLVTVERQNATTLEMNGLKVESAKTLSFKINPDPKNIELKDISGLSITGLPDIAGTIYGHKMPIYLKELSLTGANKDGERELTMRANGVVEWARVKLNANMTPSEIVARVENPAKCLKEGLPNRSGVAKYLDATTQGRSYTIVVRNNTVDLDGLGGLSGVSDMLLNGGDLVSPEGILATGAGVIGTAVTEGPTSAATKLGDKVVDTWNRLFK